MRFCCTRAIRMGLATVTSPFHSIIPAMRHGAMQKPDCKTLGTLDSCRQYNVYFILSLYILICPYCQDGPYHSDSTASRLLSEVKHCRVELVLRWGTTLESSMFIFCLLFSCLKFVGVCCLLSLLGGGLVAAGDPLLSFPSSLFSSLICAFVDSFVVFLEALEAVDVGHDGG